MTRRSPLHRQCGRRGHRRARVPAQAWLACAPAARPAGMAGPFSFLAGAVLASLADLLADGPAPSWLVRVGPFLGGHFPARNLSLCLGRPGLLREELRRRLLAFFPGPSAQETRGALADRRFADSPPLRAAPGSH